MFFKKYSKYIGSLSRSSKSNLKDPADTVVTWFD